MSENTTVTSSHPNKTPIKGTNWSNIDATSAYRTGAIQSSGGDRDWGKWIENNRNNLILVMIIVFALIAGGGYFYSLKNKSKEAYNARIYSFEKLVLADFAKTGNADPVIAGLKALHQATGNYIGLFPVMIKSSDALLAKGQREKALDVLNLAKELSHNEYSGFLLNTRLAVVYEDLGKNQEAIDVLTKLTNSDLKVFQGKFYLDLGRIYQKIGNKEKAKASFQFVVEKAKEDAEFVKIAKLYLANL